MGIATLSKKNAPSKTVLLGGRAVVCKGTLDEWLPRFAAGMFDAEFADPPYELGFMSRSWDSTGIAFNPATWRAVSRVLKPGALSLNFGGSRTFHRMMVAIEDAGLYLADTFAWCYGSGMPKGLDISKAMDAFFEQDRPRVQNRPNERKVSQSLAPNGFNLPGWQPTNDQPIHPSAHLWDGYNTALKPAWEPVPLFVKPGAPTYALQALVHECGVLNIDGSRIGSDPITVKGGGAKYYAGGKSAYAANEVNVSHNGRHPANLVFSHHPLCKYLGVRKVKGLPTEYKEVGGERPEDRVFGKGKTGLQSQYVGRNGFGDDGGTETVPHWKCHANCPVRMLDVQSGVSAAKAAKLFKQGKLEQHIHSGGMGWDIGPANTYTDKGGASRYFLQTMPVRFLYVPKASRSERDQGLTGKMRAVGALQGSRDGTLNPAPEGLNDHECVKPIDLCRYYATLLLPPPRPNGKRRIIVPFSGSGSEMIGALLAGWDEVVGIEMDGDHVRKAIERINHHCKHLART